MQSEALLLRRCGCATLQQRSMQPPWRPCIRGVRKASAIRAAAGSSVPAAASPEEIEARKEGFLARLLKPLKDFGFGTRSFWEGGVGLFVFAGIGKY